MRKIGSRTVKVSEYAYYGEYLPGTPMAKGKARGGPRDGITLEASPNWDGIVRRSSGKNSIPYKGKYEWRGDHWLWKPNEKPRKVWIGEDD